MLNDRGCGILLHITSLPSDFGIGDFGPEAYKFVDFLSDSRIKYWQILPMNPTSPHSGNSPYSSDSAFAGNILLISPEALVDDGFIKTTDLYFLKQLDFETAHINKLRQLNIAYNAFKKTGMHADEFIKFKNEHSNWLENYSLFKILKGKFKNSLWNQWPGEFKNRKKNALNSLRNKSQAEIDKISFYQFIFYRQWFKLKNYCLIKNIAIIGDIPYYVASDSADVWTHSQNFKLSKNKIPQFVGGVPPDYFSKTGQLWGSPVYNWDIMKSEHFSWWVERIEHNLQLVDYLRLDHFRAFSAYWEVPAGEDSAINGKWIKVPGEEFFLTLKSKLKDMPIIAEDLGEIDEPVRKLISKFNLPGMKVLQFAFDNNVNNSPHALHNHIQNEIVYTGTHDNPTTRAWFQNLSNNEVNRISNYTGIEVTEQTIAKSLIKIAMMSVAKISIIPMQDFLNSGDEATMNRPGTTEGNWRWQLGKTQLNRNLQQEISGLVELYERN
jgi:4-alpha-glucanotransferase